MTTLEVAPPHVKVGPLGWLRKNLFSTWYNVLLTLLAAWALVALLRPGINWAFQEARWGAIRANLTLFMVGQYPRDQLWRIWLSIYLLMGLIGISWAIWKKAVRDFGIIILVLSAAFSTITLLMSSNTGMKWILATVILLASYFTGGILRGRPRIAWIGWLLYFPIVLLLIAGIRWIPFLPPVDMGLWGGLLLTLVLTVVGNLGALPLGILLALGRRSNLPAIRLFCIGYIELVRGVPLITILYMAAILLQIFLPPGLRLNLVIRAMVGFILFEAAYQAENVRGGLQSIPRGQFEAAQAVGLNGTLTMILVILPQALRAVIPALLNSFISLFKDTSLVSIIGLFDLLRVGRSVLAQSEWLGTHREVFLFAFIVYWGFNLVFSLGSHRIEEALGVGKR